MKAQRSDLALTGLVSAACAQDSLFHSFVKQATLEKFG
jgi:hypothetical protein